MSRCTTPSAIRISGISGFWQVWSWSCWTLNLKVMERSKRDRLVTIGFRTPRIIWSESESNQESNLKLNVERWTPTKQEKWQPSLYCWLNEYLDPVRLLINIRRFLRECIGSHIFDDSDLDDSSCWPADTSYPCGGIPMVMPCAAAATTQTEMARMDNNFIFSREE